MKDKNIFEKQIKNIHLITFHNELLLIYLF